MTGSLQVKNNIYQVVLNYQDDKGKRKQKWISTGFPTKGNKKRAEQFLNNLLRQYSDTTYTEPSKIMLCDFIEEWVKSSKSNIQITTYDNYIHMLNKHIYPYFSDSRLTLSQVKPIHIQQYHNHKIAFGLSPNTVIKHHAIIRSALQSALKQGIVKENVADLVDKPKKQRYSIDFYNQEEINKLFSCVRNTAIETPVILAAYLGLRRSEVLGLKWNSVDFVNKTISIQHKVVRANINGKLTFMQTDDLKTNSSYRVLPLEGRVFDYLTNLCEKQKENQRLFKSEYINDYRDYVCVNAMGDLLKPDFISGKFLKIIAQNNLNHITFHGLRHSCASLLLSLGYGMKDIQEYLGHANYQITADLYTHVDPRNKRSMASGISNVLSI